MNAVLMTKRRRLKMRKYKALSLLIILIFASSFVFTSCKKNCSDKKKSCDKTARKECSTKEKNAVAIIQPTSGNNIKGIVYFKKTNKKIEITATVEGLTPNQKHGFHIHEYGDISSLDGTSAGGHYNPKGVQHQLPDGKDERHLGDLGNLSANAEGKATFSLTVDGISLCTSKNNSIVGRSVIVHQKEDIGAQPTGNAGPRIGMGVIGIAK